MRIINLVLVVTILALVLSCDSADDLNRTYTLEWEDDFEGPAGELPNPANWNYDLGGGGWGNQELQTYTNDPANVSMDGNGNLIITAIRNGNAFTSARIKTQDKFERTYGRFEARLKTPFGPGIWPAFWLLGDGVDDPAIGWPQTGEIDIMELRGQEPSKIAGSVHGPGYSAGNAVTSDFELDNARFDTEYHVFAVDWGPDFIDFFVDDLLYQRITPADVSGEWVFDHNFFIIFNIAVGGNYVGFPSPQTPFPQKMIIDYVRYYTF